MAASQQYIDANQALKAFIDKTKATPDNTFANDDASRLAKLFKQLLTDIEFHPTCRDEIKDDLLEKTRLLINSVNSGNAVQSSALFDFEQAFDIKRNTKTEQFTATVAAIVGMISGLFTGLFFGCLALISIPSLLLTEKASDAFSMPFVFAYHGAIFGYHSAESAVLGTPQAIINKIEKSNLGFFTSKTEDVVANPLLDLDSSHNYRSCEL